MFSQVRSKSTKSSKLFFSQQKTNINIYEKLEKIFSETINRYYEENKLFSIKIGGKTLKNSISEYFTYVIENEGKVILSSGRKQEIIQNNPIIDKLFFILSPPENGQNLIINELKKKYPCFIQKPSLGYNADYYKENDNNNLKEGDIYEDYSSVISLLESHLSCEQDKIIIFENFPVDLFLLSLKGKMFKSWENFLNIFKKSLIYFLNNKISKNICVFYWTDEKLKPYQLISLFGSDIIYDDKCKLIDINPIPETRIKSIIIEIYEKLNTYDNNIIEKVDDIYCRCSGNIYQIKQLIYYDILSYNNKIYKKINPQNKLISKKFLKKKVKPKKNKKLDKAENNSIFHLLGKLLYNKRLVKGEKSPRRLTKNEMITLPNEIYYNLQELIDSIPMNLESFNELLLENTSEHVYDIEELSDIYETFSFTDSFNDLNYLIPQKNYPKIDTLRNDKIYLNCLSVITFNLSQYNISLNKIFRQIDKANFKYKVEYNDELYIKYGEYNPSIFGLPKKKFFTDVQWLVEILGNYKKNEKNKIITKSIDEIAKDDENLYRKEKDLDIIELEKAEEGSINKKKDDSINNKSSTEKKIIKKYRNIKQEIEEKDDKLINNLLNDESSDSDSAELIDE